jgi:hypothetical protein
VVLEYLGDRIMTKKKRTFKLIPVIVLLFIPVLIFRSILLADPVAEESETPSQTMNTQNELPSLIKISSSGAPSTTPLVVADSGGSAHVIWIEGTGRSSNVFYNTNRGGSWGNPVNTSSDIKIGGSGPWPDFAIDTAGRLHYVLTAVSDYPNYEIFYKQNTDNQWLQSQNISNTAEPDSGGSACPSIATSPTNNNCYAVWYDDIYTPDRWHLYFTYKSGGSWSSARALSVDNGTYIPEIDVDGSGRAHLIWIKRGKGSSVVWYSSNSNPTDINSWTEPINISGDSNEDWCEPDISVNDNGNVHIAWIQNKGGNREIYVRSRINGTWGDRRNISNTSTKSYLPRIASDRSSGNVYVVWQERTGGKWQIYFAYSQDGKWSETSAITKNSSESVTPDVYVDQSGEVHIVYSDNSSGGYNIWYVSTKELGEIIRVLYPPTNVRINTALDGSPDKKKNIVTWKKNSANDNETVKNYKIYKKQSTQGVSSYKLHRIVSNSTFRFEDNALSVNYKYSYVVTTLDNEGEESDYSNEASEPLVYPPVNLSTESELDDTKTKKINIITWKRNPRNNSTIKSYKIYRKEASDATYNEIKTVSGSTYTYHDNNLPTGKKYVYRLSAVDKDNRECEPSFSTYEKYVFPPINLNLVTIHNEGMFFQEKINRMKWKSNPLNDPVNVTKYAIYRKKSVEAKPSYVRVFEDFEKAFEFWDRNLPLDVKYSYAVTSVCENGAESKLSNSRIEK